MSCAGESRSFAIGREKTTMNDEYGMRTMIIFSFFVLSLSLYILFILYFVLLIFLVVLFFLVPTLLGFLFLSSEWEYFLFFSIISLINRSST